MRPRRCLERKHQNTLDSLTNPRQVKYRKLLGCSEYIIIRKRGAPLAQADLCESTVSLLCRVIKSSIVHQAESLRVLALSVFLHVLWSCLVVGSRSSNGGKSIRLGTRLNFGLECVKRPSQRGSRHRRESGQRS